MTGVRTDIQNKKNLRNHLADMKIVLDTLNKTSKIKLRNELLFQLNDLRTQLLDLAEKLPYAIAKAIIEEQPMELKHDKLGNINYNDILIDALLKAHAHRIKSESSGQSDEEESVTNDEASSSSKTDSYFEAGSSSDEDEYDSSSEDKIIELPDDATISKAIKVLQAKITDYKKHIEHERKKH